MPTTLTPAEVFPPGEYLRDELEERGWTGEEFAEIIGRPVQAVSEILNGRKQIVTETAFAIADALGTSASLWMDLQTAYNLHQARAGRPATSDVARRSALRAAVPVAELRRRGWLPDTNDIDRLEQGVKELLGVDEIGAVPRFAVAARRSNAEVERFTPQQAAWLAKVRILAEGKSVMPFNCDLALSVASEIAHRIFDPNDLGELEAWLAECGIVLITLLPLKSSKMDGAAMLSDDGTPIIGLSSRGDRMDGYVFTLLHEMAHICLGHLESHGVVPDEDIDPMAQVAGFEGDANQRAAAWIMPEGAEIPMGRRPSMATVLQVAGRYRVHPSFVIGRIQRAEQDYSILRRSIAKVRPFVTCES
jgi:HTH-type transcriptional regulator/antitoxin HigA